MADPVSNTNTNTNIDTDTDRTPHIAILSSPGVGHLLPTAQFATNLVHNHGFSVTLITLLTNHSNVENAVFASLPKQVTLISIPPPSTDGPSQLQNRIGHSVTSNIPFLRNLLVSRSSAAPISAFVVDIFGGLALDIARELNIPAYVFFTCAMLSLCVGFEIVDLQVKFQGEYRDMLQPIQLPSCAPIYGSDFPDIVQDRNSELHALFLQITKKISDADGIILNSFEDLERGAINYLKERRKCVPAVYPVGPLVWSGSRSESSGSEIRNWLDEQPMDSVIYVSFGSGGTLTPTQMEELAFGLEMSELRFLWVVRGPNSEADSTFFNSENAPTVPSEFLPQGFLERTKKLGLVVATWASQLDVLAHNAVGGFLTHCGWNSVLESVVKGVPMIAWPLYAEQRTNAVLITEDLKVALRPTTGESGLVERGEIARVIKCLMEEDQGKGMRARARKLSDLATQALGEGGSSFRTSSELANIWKNGQRGRSNQAESITKMSKANTRVCVTGGAGYIGSWLVKKLLDKGYIVHVTLRNLDDGSKVKVLKSLSPGAENRLLLFKADLYNAEEFEDAIRGCEFVFLVATPMEHYASSTQFEDTSEAAVNAVRSILKSCQKSGSVKRVIYTGSVTACSPLKEDVTGFKAFMDESCWTPIHLPFRHCDDFMQAYICSKTLAEKEALTNQKSEDENSMEVVSLACGLVGGDSLLPYASGSLKVMASPFMGDLLWYKQLKFLQALLGSIPIIHIDDVCEAHIFCMEKSSLSGRFLCASDYPTMQAFVDYYDQNYPELSATKEIEGTDRMIPCNSRKLVDAGFKYRYGMKQIFDGSVNCIKSLEGHN